MILHGLKEIVKRNNQTQEGNNFFKKREKTKGSLKISFLSLKKNLPRFPREHNQANAKNLTKIFCQFDLFYFNGSFKSKQRSLDITFYHKIVLLYICTKMM